MRLKFHNTMTGQVDEFIPQTKGKALIYTCGPTVYYYPHIGNWAAFIYWDILVRILIANDYEVIRVMNITDVGHMTSDSDDGDDKMEKGASREGKNAWEIAKFYTDDFLKGVKKLNLITPTFIARATDFIPRQLDMVRSLKEKGYTYQIGDGIYFDTSKFENYSKLANIDIKSLKAGARIKQNLDKRNPSDFALWKFSPKNTKRDMEWPTPDDILEPTDSTGPVMGFPGWHLECSAIAKNFLGNTLDIHTGGIDAIPIHHTNEIAQSESANGVKFCNYWLHNNFLKANGTKISKSLGNGYTLDEILNKGFSMMDFRMFILQGHYRNEGNFTFENLQSAKNRLKNWKNMAAIRHQIHGTFSNSDDSVSLLAKSQAIIRAVSNDLGTPDALKIIDETFSNLVNIELSKIDRDAFIQLLETIDSVLGLQLIKTTPDISDEAKQLIIQRKIAREQKDWQNSDKLRDILAEQNVIVKDTANYSIWEYKD